MRVSYKADLKEYAKYFTIEDSFAYKLYHGLESGKIKILYLRKHDRRIYFVNGDFPKGLKVLAELRKKGVLIE